MHKYKLLIAYDGTDYAGWQVQPNGTSIQELIEKAVSTALRTPTGITGSGRTDAGVHAYGQTAHFTAPVSLDTEKLLFSLNGLLPKTIRILAISPVEETFHARYSAIGKIYHYHLHLERFQNPFTRLYTTHIPYPLDLNLIQTALPFFIGTHDFTSFANEAHRGSAAKNPTKTLKRIDLQEESGGVRFEFEADGFLYKMVRNIVGTLIEVGAEKRDPLSIPHLFASRDRQQADAAAPPQGLFLQSVIY